MNNISVWLGTMVSQLGFCSGTSGVDEGTCFGAGEDGSREMVAGESMVAPPFFLLRDFFV